MTLLSLRFLVLPVLFSMVSVQNAQAQPARQDSTPVLLAMNTKTTKSTVVLRKANVILPDLFVEHKENAESFIREYANTQRNTITYLYKHSSRYFPKAKAILKKHNVPQEFLALMAIESGFNAKAVSYAGAVGWWQFMDATAKDYGLKIIEGQKTEKQKAEAAAKAAKTANASSNATAEAKPAVAVTDDRWNITKSSNAAARYLRDSYRVLGDWLLVAASYNCGIGRVKNAMAASGKKNPDFWDIKQYLPGQTRNYVMKFIALNTLFKNYHAFNSKDMLFDDITKEVEMPAPALIMEEHVL